MAVGGGGRVEALGEGVLGFGGEVELVFYDEDEVFVESVVEGVERGVCRLVSRLASFHVGMFNFSCTGEVLEIHVLNHCAKVDISAWWRCQRLD